MAWKSEHHFRNLARSRDSLTGCIIALRSATERMVGDDWIDAMALLDHIEHDVAPRLSSLRTAASDRFDELTRHGDFELMRLGEIPFPDERRAEPEPVNDDGGIRPVLADTAPVPALPSANVHEGRRLVEQHGGLDEAMMAYEPDSEEFDHLQAYRYVLTGQQAEALGAAHIHYERGESMTATIPTAHDLRFDNPDADGTMPNHLMRLNTTGMLLYAIHCMGWMTLVEAPDRDEAIVAAKQIASSGSLLPSDIETVCNEVDDDSDGFQGIRIATAEDIEQFRLMTEPMPAPSVYTYHVWCLDGSDAVFESTRDDIFEFVADEGLDTASIRAVEQVAR